MHELYIDLPERGELSISMRTKYPNKPSTFSRVRTSHFSTPEPSPPANVDQVEFKSEIYCYMNRGVCVCVRVLLKIIVCYDTLRIHCGVSPSRTNDGAGTKGGSCDIIYINYYDVI